MDFKTVAAVPFKDMIGKAGAPEKRRPDVDAHRAFISGVNKRRFACLKEAEKIVNIMPEEGETLHGIMTGLYDLMHLIVCITKKFKTPVKTLRIATLSMSRRNIQEMAALYDGGSVMQIDVLTSNFFKHHDEDIYVQLLEEFGNRGQRVATARCHCKVATLGLPDAGYVLEGSANLRTNRNTEQFALSCDRDLHQWYDAFIDEMMVRNAAHD